MINVYPVSLIFACQKDKQQNISPFSDCPVKMRKQPKSDSICFKEKPPEAIVLEDFCEKIRNAYGDKKELASILHACVCKENFSGYGAFGNYYKIPKISGYGLKIARSQNVAFDELTISVDEFAHDIKAILTLLEPYNFGQIIAKIGDRVLILKHAPGVPVGATNRLEIRRSGKGPVDKQVAQRYFEEAQKIADLSQATFDDFAEKGQILTQKGAKVDSLNPNNFLVDYENQQINMVDIDIENPSKSINTVQDLIVGLCDGILSPRIVMALDSNQSSELINKYGRIAHKLRTAAAKTGLSDDKEAFQAYLEHRTAKLAEILKRKGMTSMVDELQRFSQYVLL